MTGTLGQPRPSSRPTMRDVAKVAGVGLKTVSRVVNNEPGVTTELAERVRRAIADLEYRPDISAASLRRSDRRTGAVGVALDDVSNPFSSAVLRGVEDVARRDATVVFTASLDSDARREREVLHSFVARRVDGIILTPTAEDTSWLATDVLPYSPVVAIDRRASGQAVDTVLSTNMLGAEQAVRHLIDHGHRRIAFLGDRETLTTAVERRLGYLQALSRAGIDVVPGFVLADLRGESDAESRTLGLFAGDGEHPTAVFAAQNLLTAGVIRALQRLDLHHRIALVGFDDVPLGDLVRPGVTVIAQDAPTIGREAARLLVERIAAGPAASADLPARTVLVPTRLIRRGSGEIRP